MNQISKYLTKLRTNQGLSQVDIAHEFTKRGIPMTNKGVWAWENGRAQPNAENFLILCDILQIADIRDAFHRYEISPLLAGINDEGKEKIYEYIQLLRASNLYEDNIADVIPFSRTLKRFLLPVSAGTGHFLDGESYDEIEVGDEVPQIADFGVTISGDSMEPQFIHGQTVWIHEQETLNNGEIGIFLYDGEAYIKKLRILDGAISLLSLNTQYEPIVIKEDGNFKVFGKVVS